MVQSEGEVVAIPTRHSGAPHLGGEKLRAADLEEDIANLYAQFNGNLDNANFSPSAGIEGEKFLDASIGGDRLQDGSVLNDKVQDAAVTTAKLSGTFGPDKPLVGAIHNAHMETINGEIESPPGVWTEAIVSSLVTGPAGSSVQIWVWLRLRQTQNADAAVPFQFRLKRDSTVLYTSPSLYYWLGDSDPPDIAWVTAPVPFYWVETGHSALTSHSWRLEVFSSGASNYVSQRRLTVVEMRR